MKLENWPPAGLEKSASKHERGNHNEVAYASSSRTKKTQSHEQPPARDAAEHDLLAAPRVIKTTLPKAKELRRVVEPIITLGKKPSLSNRRLAFNRLRDREMVMKLFDELGPRFASRNGGYLRILKFGFRKGDNAPMALVELMDHPEPAAACESEEKTRKEQPAEAQA